MMGSLRRTLAVGRVAVLASVCGAAPPESLSATTSFEFTTPAPSTPARPVQVTPVIAVVVAAPVPVPATDGMLHLAYELQLTNVLDGDVTLKSLTVDGSGTSLLTLTGDRLASRMRALGAGQALTATLGPGRVGIVWSDVTLDRTAAVPANLTHTVVVELAKPTPPLLPANITEAAIAPVTVSTHPPAVISPPLRGPRWLDGNSCCDMTAHRMAMNPLDGTRWAAERFAIDYVQLSSDGSAFSGERSRPQSYPYFGADVHAVADGPVVSVLDGLPEQIAGASPTGLPLDQYAGNHVVQDIVAAITRCTHTCRPGVSRSRRVTDSAPDRCSADSATAATPTPRICTSR